ncbi:hypothetical protein F4560_002370 [Saccharothrix ecbatanensis]|uniref:EF-hand domain-containing protein n=1 Tax=Saccharothrix ecbatanensis TaxID=1105145 RepID=A0A7W9M0C0_9PSEU|nr:hypothetical protein [Saccharothrix ecbatanensis]MBB5802602.1 hypothetical protein [Saccharothrix ecbatanensis]
MDDGDLVERFTRRLRLFDSNADGIVRRRDVVAAAERLVRVFRVDPRSIGAERIRTAYEMLSLALLAEFGDQARDEVAVPRFAEALAADPCRRTDLGHRIAGADAVAVRECLAPIGASVKAEHVAEVIVVLGAHPGHQWLIQQTLERDAALILRAAVIRPFAAYFAGCGYPGLYGRA